MRRTKRLPLAELQPYLFDAGPIVPRSLDTKPEPVSWPAVFGNDGPVEIEVGFGKGAFILNSAQHCPNVNWFGIEIMRKYQLFAATRMAVRQLGNVRLACADARLFLRDRVATGSVRAIHVYFPDPWWKKRHHKRRVFTPEFVEACVKAIAPGGRLHLATDVPEYFAVMTDLCRQRSELREMPTPAAGDVMTNFERKAVEKGQGVDRAVFARL